MTLPIYSLENHIPDKIFKRGIDYQSRGLVEDFTEKGSGICTAFVLGSDEYRVSITIEDGLLTDASCDCPFEALEICKHIVAVIQEYIQRSTPDVNRTKKKKRKKRLTKQEKVDEILKQLSSKEIKDYLGSLIGGYKEIRNDFLMNFSERLEKQTSYGFYNKQIKDSLRSIKGRHGFIAWNETKKVWQSMQPLINQAGMAIIHQQYDKASYICTAMLKNIVAAIEYTDDSNGDLGDLIDQVCNMLFELVELPLTDHEHNYLWSFCLTEYKAETFKGWDWHLLMMELAAYLSRDKDEADQVIDLIDKGSLSDYYEEKAAYLKLQLQSNYLNESEFLSLQHEQRGNPIIRKDLIQKCIVDKAYDQARNYAREGQEYDKKDKPGLVGKWVEWELRIAQIKNDKKEILRLARYQYLDNWTNEQNYFQILKDLTAKSKWKKYRETLVDDIKKKPRHGLLESLYIREQMWDQLLELIQNQEQQDYLINYENHLGDKFPEEMSLLFEEKILEMLSGYGTNRKTYKVAVTYIKGIERMTSKNRAMNIVGHLRELYKRKPALLDELSKV